MEALTPFWGILCSDLFFLLHYIFLPPTEQGMKGFWETGLCLLTRGQMCPEDLLHDTNQMLCIQQTCWLMILLISNVLTIEQFLFASKATKPKRKCRRTWAGRWPGTSWPHLFPPHRDWWLCLEQGLNSPRSEMLGRRGTRGESLSCWEPSGCSCCWDH